MGRYCIQIILALSQPRTIGQPNFAFRGFPEVSVEAWEIVLLDRKTLQSDSKNDHPIASTFITPSGCISNDPLQLLATV